MVRKAVLYNWIQIQSPLVDVYCTIVLSHLTFYHVGCYLVSPYSQGSSYSFLINLLRGLVSSEWSRCDTPAVTPSICTSILRCLDCLVSSVHSIWKFRCDQRHSVSNAIHASEARRQACTTITSLYTYRNLVLPTDRHIFHSSLADHLTQSTSDLQAWILNHKSYISHSVTTAQQQHVSHTIPISAYFNPLFYSNSVLL